MSAFPFGISFPRAFFGISCPWHLFLLTSLALRITYSWHLFLLTSLSLGISFLDISFSCQLWLLSVAQSHPTQQIAHNKSNSQDRISTPKHKKNVFYFELINKRNMHLPKSLKAVWPNKSICRQQFACSRAAEHAPNSNSSNGGQTCRHFNTGGWAIFAPFPCLEPLLFALDHWSRGSSAQERIRFSKHSKCLRICMYLCVSMWVVCVFKRVVCVCACNIRDGSRPGHAGLEGFGNPAPPRIQKSLQKYLGKNGTDSNTEGNLGANHAPWSAGMLQIHLAQGPLKFKCGYQISRRTLLIPNSSQRSAGKEWFLDSLEPYKVI